MRISTLSTTFVFACCVFREVCFIIVTPIWCVYYFHRFPDALRLGIRVRRGTKPGADRPAQELPGLQAGGYRRHIQVLITVKPRLE